MKKLIALLCIAALVLSFSAVAFADTAAEEEEEPVELIVFAAASMTEAMNNIIADYEALYPNVTIIATYDSSGALAMTTPGDTTMASKKEVEAVMGGAGARVAR